jgi:hypothetical protein
MFKAEDAVSVDTSDYELASPGVVSKSPAIVLAVGTGPRPCYHVRLWLPLGTAIDVSVPAGKVSPRQHAH